MTEVDRFDTSVTVGLVPAKEGLWVRYDDYAALRAQLADARKAPAIDVEQIAKAIGHHFWECDTDEGAISAGMDAARDVLSALEGV